MLGAAVREACDTQALSSAPRNILSLMQEGGRPAEAGHDHVVLPQREVHGRPQPEIGEQTVTAATVGVKP